MKRKKNIGVLERLLKQLEWNVRHQRLRLFWAIAFIGLVLPWLPSCDMAVHQACTRGRVHDGDTVTLICGGEKTKGFYPVSTDGFEKAENS
jgi:hypothetical protein